MDTGNKVMMDTNMNTVADEGNMAVTSKCIEQRADSTLSTIDPASTSTKSSTPLAELRNGKVLFKQKCVAFEKLSETMQEIVKFREMIQQRLQDREPPLNTIPSEHKPVLGKLVHESDKSLSALCKHIQEQLLPADEEDEGISTSNTALPLTVIETEVTSIAHRKNYGLDSCPDGGRIPSSLCVWRWELDRQLWAWLPKSAREKAESRHQERMDAKQQLASMFASLKQEERDALLNRKSGAKQKQKQKEKENPKVDVIHVDHPINSATAPGVAQDDAQEAEGSNTPQKTVARYKKVPSFEEAAKEKEKLEKKTTKAEQDKKKKEAQEKSRSLMANFFCKGKTKGKTGSTAGPSTNKGVVKESSSSTKQSDFDNAFKPFALKKGVDLAPVNRFTEAKKSQSIHRGQSSSEAILIDDDETRVDLGIVMRHNLPAIDVSSMSSRDRLASLLTALPPSVNPALLKRPASTTPHLKTYTTHSVREVMAQLSEAEVAGDESRVRDLLNLLRSRSKIPAKIFCFADDARPGYFGTFTRTSRIIGSRSPFVRDTVAHDYNYDSGEEWEEEGEGEEVDGSDEEGGEAAADEEDSDLDSWLVDDDDVEEVGTPIEERAGSPGFFPPPLSTDKKRKSVASEARPKAEKKRKVIVPLVPFTKGPCWENAIGQCDYEPFEAYRIQLFNDTPYPIDPFTFVLAPSTASKNPAHRTNGVFLVPPVPGQAQSNTATSCDSAMANTPALPTTIVKRASGPAPKTSFPDDHLPALLSRIRLTPTANLTVLIEMVYASFQEQRIKVKKNALEAKIREVCEKCKFRKVWVVKGESQDPFAA
ncbi:hypothetical protein NEOLEDRAFT_1175854 [Neolentinus lepideus HHB14362 ss-1]|uniref:Chromatin assembly factor 1 subunit A dimerization domain-containing protein n=1 Tax=Neolentinus lepideus HHB14362 ss-1 TaxID=1314782 RepID=A0A165UQN3_9AGAM|nr:hypothetical protein NEOLEDRAFT_1175854 [Neolentinus lepideus HHB14362 ss-1]